MTSLFLKWVIKISYFFLTGLQHKMSHPYIAFEYIDFCDNFSVNRAALRARFQCIFRAYFQRDFVCTISMYFCVIPFFYNVRVHGFSLFLCACNSSVRIPRTIPVCFM